MLRTMRLGFWFWVAMLALLLNPMVDRLLLSVLQFVVQFVAVHVV